MSPDTRGQFDSRLTMLVTPCIVSLMRFSTNPNSSTNTRRVHEPPPSGVEGAAGSASNYQTKNERQTMKQKLRLSVASALVAVVMVISMNGFGNPAEAIRDCWYTGHATAYDACGHDKVVWEETTINSRGHFHEYRHDVSGWRDHHPRKWISG